MIDKIQARAVTLEAYGFGTPPDYLIVDTSPELTGNATNLGFATPGLVARQTGPEFKAFTIFQRLIYIAGINSDGLDVLALHLGGLLLHDPSNNFVGTVGEWTVGSGTTYVDWGDGSPVEDYAFPYEEASFSVPHTYAEAGTYPLAVRMTFDGEPGQTENPLSQPSVTLDFTIPEV